MSYLLKALKKAEEERKQNSQDMAPSQVVHNTTASLPKPLLWVVFLLAVATIWQMMFSERVANPSESAVLTNSSDMRETPVANVQSPSQSQTVAESETQNWKTIGPAITPNDEIASPVEQVEQPVHVKDLSELSQVELSRIPSLNLASHIYSSAAAYRSVVINGQAYQEGDLIQPGLILEEISQNGIVINIQGLKVSLPKGISWIASQNVK